MTVVQHVTPSQAGAVAQIKLANPRGFCAGVDRAIDIVNRALDIYGAPIYVRHEVVHNKFVVDTLRQRGAIFVDELADIPSLDSAGRASIVVFSAHGVAQAVKEEAEQRGFKIFGWEELKRYVGCHKGGLSWQLLSCARKLNVRQIHNFHSHYEVCSHMHIEFRHLRTIHAIQQTGGQDGSIRRGSRRGGRPTGIFAGVSCCSTLPAGNGPIRLGSLLGAVASV